MAWGLRSAGVDVSCVGNLRTPLDLPLRLAERLSERLGPAAGRRSAVSPRLGTYRAARSPALAACRARLVSGVLERSRPDVVVSPGTLAVARLGGPTPLAIWTDASFGGMLDYYPEFTGLSRRTVRDGHRLEECAYRRASIVAFSSDWAARTALRYPGLDPAKVHVIPFGANLDDVPSRDDALAWARRRPRDRCRLLLVGVDWERKGVTMAVAVTGKLRAAGLDATLSVIGCRPPGGVDLPPYVEMGGFADKQTAAGRAGLDRAFRSAHFFVLPSVAECFGIVYAEAAAYAVPSLARDTGGVASAVRDGVTGRVFAAGATAAEYADFVLRTMADNDRYVRYAEASRRDYDTRLDWAVGAGRLADLLTAFA